MKKKIAVLPGDGIGKEVAYGAIEVLKAIGQYYKHDFEFEFGLIGGEAIDKCGTPLPEETIELCRSSDAVLLGAVGGPKWDKNLPELRPEKGLLGIRKELDLFANIRPVQTYKALQEISPLKGEKIEDVDLVIVRELTSGLYFGKPSERIVSDGEEAAVDTLFYKRKEIERILETAFQMAQKRRGKVTSVDKANVLTTSKLWREIAEELASKYPDITLEHMLVDNAAMQLIRMPSQFDVIVTENMFGDILSDEASMITGSLGMLPSASLSNSGLHLYEPVHGSAPDIAGQNLANPVGMILSGALMLRYSFDLHEEARAIEKAVKHVLDSGKCTRDLTNNEGAFIHTTEMVEEIKEVLANDYALLNIIDSYE
ncbi:3-isopropylmalate dehydrogenase [Aeribacillus sp. FSL M8-0254]|uniref:3-isopropylmalate dehydrogenase n=1 Tax=Aeribacillus sp. FSL M8-0254 TaxID=2954577 RepID=UPI0030FCBAAE